MKKIIISFLLIAITIATAACGANNNETKPASAVTTTAETVKEKTTSSPKLTKDESKTSAQEKLAMDYITIYQNGTDPDAMKKFVADHVHPDVQEIFNFGASGVREEADIRKNPKVVKTIEYKNENTGKDGYMVLIQSDGGLEDIIYIYEGKVGFVYESKDADIFSGIRKLFE